MTLDPEFEEMAREFRRALREEQAELEAIALESDLGSLDLPYVFLEAQWRGDALRIVCPGRTFIGGIIHVGETIVTVALDNASTADISIPSILGVAIVQPSASPGSPRGGRDPVQFVARLREYAGHPHAIFEFGSVDPAAGIIGKLTEVRADHVVVRTRDNATWLMPLATLSYVVSVPLGR